MPITTIKGGRSPVKRVILYPSKDKVPKTQMTTIPIIIIGTITVSYDLKKIKSIIEVTIKETNNNIESSCFTLSAKIYLE